jgi:hypothetical protein
MTGALSIKRRVMFMILLAGILPCSLVAQANQSEPPTLNPTCTCVGRVGDVNQSGSDEPTIGDVIDLVIFVLGERARPASLPCLEEADINQSGQANPTADDITIADISALLNYLFIAGPNAVTLPTCLEGGAR